MNNLKIKTTLIQYLPITTITLAVASFSGACFANDISQNLRNNTQAASSSENYLEVGVMTRVRDEATYKGSNGKGSYTSTGLFINGSYNWNNLFIENYSESGHGLVVGYNAFNNDNWSFDVMANTDWGHVSFENNGRYYSDKDEFTLGGRLSGYLGNNIVQLAINQDATGDHNGTTASALIGRNWQLRNWNFHGIIGVEYVSAKLNDYNLGVSDETASHFDIEAYEADGSVNFSTEIGVTYPISENWVFRATGRAVTIPDEVTDSPRYANMDSLATSFRTSLSYVF
jgi:outer membrane scaffolding protein for murein synthesis (MipA/OmpV family)